MRISTSTDDFVKKLGYAGALKALKEAGFDAFDFSVNAASRTPDAPMMQADYMVFAAEIKKMADDAGLVCNQAHATHPPEKFGDEEYNRQTFDLILRQMEVAAFLGAGAIVVHGVTALPNGVDAWAENLRFYRSLQPYCEKFNIRVAVENLFEYDEKRARWKPCGIGTSEKLAEFMEQLDPSWFTVCLDVGHAAINGEDPEDAIYRLGKRITTVHIHDNDFVSDRHTIPYLGRINWDAVCKAFADIGYEGDFTCEASNYEGAFPAELLPAAMGLEAAVLRSMTAKIEACKTD